MKDPALIAKAAQIRMVIMDLDGVLTDGRIIYGDYGDELKFFDVQDGFGLTLLREAGIRTIVGTARRSRINHRRAKELKIDFLFQNVKDKLDLVHKMAKKHKLQLTEICFIGDDWRDAAAMQKCGLSVAVQNAAPEVKEIADFITSKNGGRGAVRETVDGILRARGLWDEIKRRYFQPATS